MQKKINPTFYIILFIVVILIAPFSAKGVTSGTTSSNLKVKLKFDSNTEIQELNQEIESKKDSIKKIRNRQEELRQAIEEKRLEKADLNNSLSILENRIAQAELDISRINTDIDTIVLEIKKTSLEIASKEISIQEEKEHIEYVLKLIHKQDDISSLEIILLNNSFSDYVNQLKYLEDINLEVKNGLNNLRLIKQQLEEKIVELIEENNRMDKAKSDLLAKKSDLEGEIDSKTSILEQTELSEITFQKLLAQAKLEQDQAASDIVGLEGQVRNKLTELQKEKLNTSNDKGFIWPVTKNTITSYFHDPDYPFRFIFEHPAIDIRAKQSSPIKAVSSGYVARAKNGGMGYSYIMLVHGNGLSTVYGHVSKIIVNEDDYVLQGQVIGYSGGLPGTPGAGPLTTGAHLHFETRLNGIPVNPLEYLP
jgi:murein DD-endopeptidase MepM/ murein hydrolase activator NlpD